MTKPPNLEEFFAEKKPCYNEHASIDWVWGNVHIETKVCVGKWTVEELASGSGFSMRFKHDDECKTCHLRKRVRPL